MPELVPLWERLTEAMGGSDLAARLLSLYRPTPYLVACSQALWTRGEPMIVRNYDYHPLRCEGRLCLTRWLGTRVIASMDSLWGVLDGMNEHGLGLTLAFGGRKVVGDGFGIPLILRYALELCRDTADAVEGLRAVPSHMAYTIGVLDRRGAFATVYVAPDQPAEVVQKEVATNHQGAVEWTEHARTTNTVRRERFLIERIRDPHETPDQFVDRFLAEPVYNTEYERAFGTLYTAVYHLQSGQMQYRWPKRSWHQSFARFTEGQALIRYDD
jgi:predicted choloylglycine hydrolase